MIARHQPDGMRGGQADIGGDTRFPRSLEPGDDRAGGRVLRRQVRRVRAEVAGQHPVRGREVVAVVVMHRSDDRHLVHQTSVVWQELGNVHAGDGRRDRLERPAKLGRCIGLGVIGLVLGRPAVEPDQDHGSLARCFSGAGGAPRCARKRLPSVRPVAPRQPTLRNPRRLNAARHGRSMCELEAWCRCLTQSTN